MEERSSIHPLVAVVGAIVIAVGLVGTYVWVTWTGPVHKGEVVSVSAYPIHRELSTGGGLGGLQGGPNVFDEVIVLADVKITSTTKLPLFLHEVSADVTLGNGDVIECLAASGDDYKKVFIAYPELAAQRKEPLPRGITMTPGQVVEGQAIFHYPITKQAWDGRRAFDITVGFVNQKSLVLHTMPGSSE